MRFIQRYAFIVCLVGFIQLNLSCGPGEENSNNNNLPINPPLPEVPEEKGWKEFSLPTSELEGAFRESQKYFASQEDITNRYKLETALTGGLSGASIFLVSLKSKNNELRVLKTLRELNKAPNIWQDISFREIYFSRLLGESKGQKFLTHGMLASDFFPVFYGFGISNTFNPFNQTSKIALKIPFYVMENIHGMSLAEFATKPDEARKKFGYALTDAPKGALFSILFQMTVALLNVYEEFSFVHLDNHPGNIFLTTTPADTMVFTSNGETIHLVGPRIKIIDFDQSELEGIHPSPRGRYQYRPKVGREFDVYKAENNTSIPPLPMALRAYKNSKNTDVRMINFLIHTFKNRFKNEAGVDVSGKYFYSLEALATFFASNAKNFGLVH